MAMASRSQPSSSGWRTTVALLFHVAHDCHHGGVGDVPVPLEVTKHITHRYRPTPGPGPAHHLDFQVTKCWHATSRHQATIQIVDRNPASRLAAGFAYGPTMLLVLCK